MKNKCQRLPSVPSVRPAAGPGCVYPGRDEPLATARSTASTLTPDPYCEGQESSGGFVITINNTSTGSGTTINNINSD